MSFQTEDCSLAQLYQRWDLCIINRLSTFFNKGLLWLNFDFFFLHYKQTENLNSAAFPQRRIMQSQLRALNRTYASLQRTSSCGNNGLKKDNNISLMEVLTKNILIPCNIS